MIETIQLCPAVTFRVCRDSRFKQGCLSFQFVRRMDSREAAKNALLPAVLLRGTREHPDLRTITEHLDTLYGASVGPLVRRVGDYQTWGFYCGFMDDRFALPGDRVLEPMLDFLEEILLRPLTRDGVFLPEFLEGEKKNIIATIEAELNDKRAYAMGRLLKTMCREDSFGLPRLGEPAQIAAVQAGELYAHYEEVLKTSPVEIFYAGSGDPAAIGEKLKALLGKIPRTPEPLPAQTGFTPCQGKHLTETMEVAQGKLCLGFTTPITNRSPEFAAMQVLNTVLGAGMTSKLFMTVREKLSLCYSIGSGYYGSKGIVTVAAGIDFDKEELTRQEILRQLSLCQAGEITEAELRAAREAVLSSLRSTHDSPGSIEGYYATGALSGMRLTPAQYMAEVEAVTLDRVVAASQSLTLHSSYFLKGGSQ